MSLSTPAELATGRRLALDSAIEQGPMFPGIWIAEVQVVHPNGEPAINQVWLFEPSTGRECCTEFPYDRQRALAALVVDG